ncbi:MAG TPA: MBL fold metallo-hydrolase [Gaiellaceae bacterium]|nr:MBL fold metallo-hydrolase [Gaiellaceae bacterium]
MIEHTFALAPDVRRLTFPLPTRPGHVHAYLLRGDDGWTLVDTGLALPDTPERIAAAAAELDAPIVRVLVTHMHPDHLGGAEPAAEATGAPVFQGELDYAQTEHVWGNPEWPHRISEWFRSHGVPPEVADELIQQGSLYAPFIRFRRDPEPLRVGDEVAGWRVVAMPGHADGHLCLIRDGAFVAGDHLLDRITPTVGLWPDSRPDPLGDYLESLRRTVDLGPRIVYPGHGEPIRDAAVRAQELVDHHAERLDAAEAALGAAPRSGYEVSFDLFGDRLSSGARRFAVAETLSHLERLRCEGRSERVEDGGAVRWRR